VHRTGKVIPVRHGGLLRETAAILLFTLVLAALSWALRPPRLPLRADAGAYELELDASLVDAAGAVALLAANEYVLVDYRAGDAPAPGLPGAFRIRADRFDEDKLELFDFFAPELPPLLLVGDGNLVVAANLAERLTALGFADVTIMRGDVAAWRAAGGEVSE
jgi:rhodanese-related sulfurtransferase